MTATTGTWSDTCWTGSMLGSCANNMFWQHRWLRFAGMQGIERQHCMAFWFIPMAGVQAPNCRSKRAAAANAKNSRFPIAPTLGRLDVGVKNPDCRVVESALDPTRRARRCSRSLRSHTRYGLLRGTGIESAISMPAESLCAILLRRSRRHATRIQKGPSSFNIGHTRCEITITLSRI